MQQVNRPDMAWYLENEFDVVIPAGKKPSIRCPFHEDRSPSARVDTDGERFTCYSGCFNGEAVDVIDIIMATKGLNFTDAKEYVKDWPGTEVDDAPAPKKTRAKRERRQRKRSYSFDLLN